MGNSSALPKDAISKVKIPYSDYTYNRIAIPCLLKSFNSAQRKHIGLRSDNYQQTIDQIDEFNYYDHSNLFVTISSAIGNKDYREIIVWKIKVSNNNIDIKILHQYMVYVGYEKYLYLHPTLPFLISNYNPKSHQYNISFYDLVKLNRHINSKSQLQNPIAICNAKQCLRLKTIHMTSNPTSIKDQVIVNITGYHKVQLEFYSFADKLKQLDPFFVYKIVDAHEESCDASKGNRQTKYSLAVDGKHIYILVYFVHYNGQTKQVFAARLELYHLMIDGKNIKEIRCNTGLLDLDKQSFVERVELSKNGTLFFLFTKYRLCVYKIEDMTAELIYNEKKPFENISNFYKNFALQWIGDCSLACLCSNDNTIGYFQMDHHLDGMWLWKYEYIETEVKKIIMIYINSVDEIWNIIHAYAQHYHVLNGKQATFREHCKRFCYSESNQLMITIAEGGNHWHKEQYCKPYSFSVILFQKQK